MAPNLASLPHVRCQPHLCLAPTSFGGPAAVKHSCTIMRTTTRRVAWITQAHIAVFESSLDWRRHIQLSGNGCKCPEFGDTVVVVSTSFLAIDSSPLVDPEVHTSAQRPTLVDQRQGCTITNKRRDRYVVAISRMKYIMKFVGRGGVCRSI